VRANLEHNDVVVEPVWVTQVSDAWQRVSFEVREFPGRAFGYKAERFPRLREP
jgi:hypothetical protein